MGRALPTVSETLRRHTLRKLEEHRMSINQLAEEAGVPQPVLQRWLSGARPDIRLSTADKLAQYFRLRLVE